MLTIKLHAGERRYFFISPREHALKSSDKKESFYLDEESADRVTFSRETLNRVGPVISARKRAAEAGDSRADLARLTPPKRRRLRARIELLFLR